MVTNCLMTRPALTPVISPLGSKTEFRPYCLMDPSCWGTSAPVRNRSGSRQVKLISGCYLLTSFGFTEICWDSVLAASNRISWLPRWHEWQRTHLPMQVDIKRYRLRPWVWKITWRRAWQPTPLFLPGESHGQRSLVGYSPYVCTELDTTKAI